MLHSKIGVSTGVSGRSCVQTEKSRSGHAIFGPYERLEPGRYVVEFNLAPVEEQNARKDFVCAVLDVTHDVGRATAASKRVYFSQLQAGRTTFALPFTVGTSAVYEYRVWVNGSVPLLIEEDRRVTRIADGTSDIEAVRLPTHFPEEEGRAIPFFCENRDRLRGLYDQGISVGIVRGAVALTVFGISLFAHSLDDLNFIGELFYERAYNFKTDRPTWAVDIGMNIGLASLMFAQKSEVQQVHAFEPFTNTFDRAMDNLTLNPELARKIQAHNYGLSDHSSDGSVDVDRNADSGAMTVVGVAGGMPVHVSIRNAGAALGPIIRSARDSGADVIVKIDCEGSEFAIFQSLERSGLLPLINGLMVEWHAMFGDKAQDDLIAPLRRAGFLVFDRSPPTGNGFFYAARIAA